MEGSQISRGRGGRCRSVAAPLGSVHDDALAGDERRLFTAVGDGDLRRVRDVLQNHVAPCALVVPSAGGVGDGELCDATLGVIPARKVDQHPSEGVVLNNVLGQGNRA